MGSTAPRVVAFMPKRSRLIRAIPTTYKNVRFRSRLEAQHARLFDTLEWPWTYEPDLQAGFVIPDFLISFPSRAVVIECKPAVTVQEIASARRTLIRKMPEWLANDVLRELKVIDHDPKSDEAGRCLEDIHRVVDGNNPLGHTRRILVAGPQIFREEKRSTLDGDYGFCLCTHPIARSHVGLALELGSMCLACSGEARSWVPPEMVIAAWREAGAAQQWHRKKKGKR